MFSICHFGKRLLLDQTNLWSIATHCTTACLCVSCSAHWYLAVICFAGLCEPVSSEAKTVTSIEAADAAASVDVGCCVC